MARGVVDERVQPSQLLRPVLDTFLNNAVAVTGCHSHGIARKSCEYDVVVVTDEQTPGTSMKFGSEYFDIFFISEKKILKPTNPEVAVSLASIQHVRDSSWVLSTSQAANQAVLHQNAKLAAEGRLADAVKALGRADEALSKKSVTDADFWLLTAAYHFASAWVFSVDDDPAPSHLLLQLKRLSSQNPDGFSTFTRAAGLERASRANCAARLDAISVLYDVLTAREVRPEDVSPTSSRVAYEIVKRKSDQMTAAIAHTDCYSFLGHELFSILPVLFEIKGRTGPKEPDLALMVSSLSTGRNKMLSEGLVRSLGLLRQEKAVRKEVGALREEVSALAKRL